MRNFRAKNEIKATHKTSSRGTGRRGPGGVDAGAPGGLHREDAREDRRRQRAERQGEVGDQEPAVGLRALLPDLGERAQTIR